MSRLTYISFALLLTILNHLPVFAQTENTSSSGSQGWTDGLNDLLGIIVGYMETFLLGGFGTGVPLVVGCC